MAVDDTVQASGSFSLTVTIDSIAYGPFRFDLTRQNDAPPSSNGIGGGTDTTLAQVTSGTYAAMTGTHPADVALDVTVAGTGDTINLNTSFEYRIPLTSAGGLPASGSVQAKGQYSSDGVTWIDMTGAAVTGSVASVAFPSGSAVQTPGSLTGAWSITGLTAGVYHVRLVGRWATGSVTLAPLNGAATSSKV
jgi:hypothetical protein